MIGFFLFAISLIKFKSVISNEATLYNDGLNLSGMMKMMKGGMPGMPTPSVKLQINPKNLIIRGLSELKDKDEPTAKLVANQLLDNALASANLLDDPREMIARSYQALEKITAN